MKVKVKIDFKRIFKKQKENAIERLEKFAELIKIKIDEKTPEKTKEFIGNTQIGETIEYNNKIYKKIYNDTYYSYYVEYGIGKIFNYHKGKKIFYTGDGAGMFARSVKELEGKFKILTD